MHVPQGAQAGPPSPHVEAAGALCALTAHNSRSQDALRAVKAMPLLLQLLSEADAPALKVGTEQVTRYIVYHV